MPDSTPTDSTPRSQPISSRHPRTSVENGRGRAVFAAALAVVAGLLPSNVHAQTTDSSEPNGSDIRFHRAFVPNEIVVQANDYLPMDRQEFQEKIKQINRRARFPRNPYIQSADYASRFVADELIDGTATWNIIVPDKVSTILSLEQMNLAIESARWLDSSEPAQFGASDQGAVLVVPADVAAKGTGTLELQWTLAGTTDALDTVEFQVKLQSSLKNKFAISTSESILITADQGLVQPPNPSPGHEDPNANNMDSSKTDLWRIDLGGIHQIKLTVTPQGSTPLGSQVLYRQNTDYSISLAGNEIDSQIHIQKSDPPLRQITLEGNANLQIRTIRWNDVLLPWHGASAPDQDKRVVTIAVPPLPSPSENVLRITATAPTQLDVLTLLPSLVPLQMLWQGGTASVAVAKSLRLQNYELAQARQTRNRDPSGLTLALRNESPEASISLRMAARTSAPRIANGVTASISNESITTESVVELRQHPPIWFRLAAEVSPDWTIEDVSSVQTDLISDWEIRNIDGQRLLEIQLRPQPRSSAVPRLRIRAVRKLNDQVASLTQSDVTPFRFRDAEYDVDLRCFRSTGEVRLDLIGRDAAGEVSAEELAEAGEDLVDVQTGDLIYSLTQQRTETKIRLQKAESQFAANCDVVLRVGEARCSEEFVIEWTPQDSRLDQVLVHLSEARNDAPQWSFVDPTARDLVARRLAQDEQQRAGLGTSGETWLFVMRDLGTAPRTIRGYRDFPQPDDAANIVPSLVMVPDARAQRAIVTLENNSAAQFDIETADGIDATLVQPGRATALHSTMGSYRYRPERHAVGPAKAIQLVRVDQSLTGSSQDKPNCWAWNASLDSHFSPDGTAQHRFTYRLENHGRRWIEMHPTEKLEIRRITIGASVVIPDDDQSESIRVDLPLEKTDIVMLVDASTEQTPWRMGNRLHAEFVRVDIPVVHAQWTVWLPEGYRPVFLGHRLRRESQPWTRQLFGWFGRHAQRLGPWSVMKRLNDATQLNPNRTLESLFSALEQQAEHSLEFGQPIKWGQVLDAAADDLPTTTILVDQAALAEEGISPNTLLDYTPAEDSISNVLQAAGIVVLQDGQRLILTTNRKRGLYTDDFAATIWPGVFQLRQGPLAKQVDDRWRFPNAAAWHASIHLPATELWGTVPGMPLASEHNLDAWHVAVDRDASDHDATDVIRGNVLILRTQVSQVLGWLGFLGSFAVSWRARIWVPYVAGVVLAIGVLLTIAIPAVQPVAWGMLAGLPFGFLIRQLQIPQRKRAAEIQSDSTVVRSTYRPYSGLSLPVWILVLVLTFSLVAVAQTRGTASGSSATIPASHRVLIPVNEQQEPEGETLFLPKDFYHQLLRLDSDESGPPTIIRRADYRARLVAAHAPDQQVGRLELEDLIATYEIETHQLNALVRIPLDPDVLDLGHSAIKLDGRAVQPIWMPVLERGDDQQRAANAAFLRVALPGTHRLELNLQTSAVVDLPANRLRMDIPRIHRSTLTVEAARQVELTVPSSQGACQRLENGQLICHLGPTDHLMVVWPALEDQEQIGETSARLLYLLDVRPHQAFLATQIHVEADSGAAAGNLTRTVELTFDEIMQWLPTSSPDVRLVEDPNPGKRRLQIVLNGMGKTNSPIRFLLPAESREVRLPTVSLERINVIEQWLGVLLEESLSASYPDGAESLAPAVFQDAWEQDSTTVNAAFQVPADAERWAVNVQPIETETASGETLELHIEGRETLVRYQAQIVVTGRGKYKHQLRTPNDLKVTQLEVVQNERPINVIWSQTDDATFVFLGTPLTGQYTMTLTGRLPTAVRSKRDIPLIWLSDAETTNFNVRLFRAPNTQLRIVDTRGFRLTQDPATPDEPSQSWRVADLQTNRPADARATIELIDAMPNIAGQLVTTVLRGESGWTATAVLHCDVTSGAVDHLTIDVPNSWRETLSVSPSLLHEIVDVGGGHRQLRIWLPEPVVGSTQLIIRGALEGVAVPELRPLNIEPLESFVRIPSATRNDQFTWSTSRLLAAAVPEKFAASDDDIEFTTYRSASRFRAELAATKPRENLPHIGLCEVHHVIGRHVDYGVATFHLEPSGLPTAVLTLPRGSVLLDVGVGGVSAQRTQVAESQWRIRLGATRLPHRLRVAYQLRHAPRRNGTWNVQSPTLQLGENLNGRTLWTISSMDDVAQDNTVLAAKSLSPVDYAMARVSALRQLFDAPDVTSVDYSDPEAMAWYAHWNGYIREHITDAKEIMKHYSSSLTASNQAVVEQTIAETESKLHQLEGKLGIQSTGSSAEDVEPLAGATVEPTSPPLTTHFGTQTSHFATGLGVSTIQIHSRSTGDFDRLMRFAGAMVMVLAGVALGFGGKPADWEVWFQNQKGVLLLFLGVLWWFALYPQWVAVIIVMMGLVLKLWPDASGGSGVTA